MYLADDTGAFRLLAFDFDAGKGDPAADADTLCGWLDQARLPHVLACSGPSGGRHVWLALAEPLAAGTVDTLARLVRARLPSLDIAPLANPVTGCVRPPGAPHRAGGVSRVLAGDLAILTAPGVSAAEVARLLEQLAGHRPEPQTPVDPAARLPVDRAGRLYLPGVRRELPPASATALAGDAEAADASAVLRRVLAGAVAARWRCADVAALAGRSPGLEHLRSQGQGPGAPRRVRSPAESGRVLSRQWDRAVRWVAAPPPRRRRAGPDVRAPRRSPGRPGRCHPGPGGCRGRAVGRPGWPGRPAGAGRG